MKSASEHVCEDYKVRVTEVESTTLTAGGAIPRARGLD